MNIEYRPWVCWAPCPQDLPIMLRTTIGTLTLPSYM